MNKASRFQRTLLFCRENESALLNQLGQGPAAYETHGKTIEKIRFGEKNRFSIPRVSITNIKFLIKLFCIDRQKNCSKARIKKNTNFLHRSSDWYEIYDKKGKQSYHRKL